MKTAVIGGDKRMLFAAKAFSDCGTETAIAGFDRLQSKCNIRVTTIEDAVRWADICILPVIPDKNGCLNCPYSEYKISTDDFARLCGKKPIFCGRAERIAQYFDGKVYDYAAREEFAVRNAALTAEGAIGLIIGQYEDSLMDADVLILGYGRIAKVLVRYLNAFGAKVTVAARKPSDRQWARLNGCFVVDISLKEINRYQLILNTIPALILDREKICRIKEDALIVDLASAPGGVDFDCAEKRGLTCIHALGIPGKTAPKAAGIIIRDTIIQMIKEENGGKDDFGLCNDRLLLHL